MPYHGIDKPSDGKENIAQSLLAPPSDPFHRKLLNRDVYVTTQLRAKDKVDTGSTSSQKQKKVDTRSISSQKQKEKVDTSSISSQKQKGKDTGLISSQKQKGKDTGLISSQKQKDKVDTGSFSSQKHNSKEMRTSGPVNTTEARVAREKKHQTRSTNAKEKISHPDRLRQHTPRIQGPVSVTKSPVAGEKKKHTKSNDAKEKMCPPDKFHQHTRGILDPVSITESRAAGEKKQQTRCNTSFPIERTTPQRGTRTSSRCSNASVGRPVDPHDRGNTAAAREQRQAAADKLVKDMENIIHKLNELGLGEDISFEEYYGYLTLLPKHTPIDTKIELSGKDCYDMEIRHAVFRIKSYKLSHNLSKNELCYDELEDCPMNLLDKEEFSSDFLVKMNFFKFFQREGVLDWSFHPKLCKPAGLTDYQRLVPRNHWVVPQNYPDHGFYEYANWEEYMSYFHTYEMEHEYIEYFETLLRELKWLKDCLPIRRTSSAIASKICTRGIYQATKIATRFSKMTSYFTRFGFYECFSYMSIEATWCDEAAGLFFEIWKRVVQEKESLKDAVKEVYKLNKFLSRQDFLKYVVEEDDLLILEKGFQTCMRGITDNVSEDEARELIAEAVKNQSVKPKFYREYIRKKMDIAQSIGLITTDRKMAPGASMMSVLDCCCSEPDQTRIALTTEVVL